MNQLSLIAFTSKGVWILFHLIIALMRKTGLFHHVSEAATVRFAAGKFQFWNPLHLFQDVIAERKDKHVKASM